MATTLRDVPVHQGSMFVWTGKHGAADISDFRSPVSGRLYADACDVGFYVVSGRTGDRVLFTQIGGPGEDNDGEAMSYEYESPGGGIRITIFND